MGSQRARPPGTLAALLRTRREGAGLTQRQLAHRAGISLGALEDLEQGRTVQPRPESLAGLAAALRLTPDQLEEDTGRAAPPAAPRGTGNRAAWLRVEVLGPLAVWRDGLPVPLGPVRQRAVLGLLVLHAGTSLNRATIIDALWGSDPPPTSVVMVQAQVSRIRRMLGSGPAPYGGARLSWDGSGYQLTPDGIGLDLAEFGEMTDQARAAAATGNAVAACELYERALRLWRGHVLEDIELLYADPGVTGLGRRRDAVVIEYAAAAASAGLPGRVLSHVEALTVREPLDERAHAQLMMILAATGRQAAALRAYQDLAGRLDTELGVRPGPELSAAHQRVLRQQIPAAGAPTAGHAVPPPRAAGPEGGQGRSRPEVPGRVGPRQLPPAVPGFAGRAGELAALTGLLDQVAASAGTVVISAIGGTAGVGKTALAVHWAHQVAGRFPDGQLYINLRGFGPSGQPVTAAEAVRQLLDGLGTAAERIPHGLDAQAGLYRSLLAGRRMLILVDNARDPGQVRPLLPGAPGCLVLVTSRNELTGLGAADGAHLLTLDVLTEEEATELLENRLGRPRVAGEPGAVTDLIGLCSRLPLALSIVAARAAARPQLPLATLAAELRGTDARLDLLSTSDAVTDVRTVFSWSCQQLTLPAARMFRMIGVHGGPDIALPAAASLAGLPAARARPALAELTGTHLLSEHVPGRYAMHDLLRAYAAEQARGTASRDPARAALHRVLDHYLHTASAASLALYPQRDRIPLDPPQPLVWPEEFTSRERAAQWLHTEQQVLMTAISQAAEAGFGRHAWQLAWAVAMFFNWQGSWQELMVTQQTALAAAVRLGDQAGQAEAHRFLGHAHSRLGDRAAAAAHLTQALALVEQFGGTAAQARAHFDLGRLCIMQGGKGEALFHVEQSLRLYRTAGHRSGLGNALNAASWLNAEMGRGSEALEYGTQALAIHRELGDRTDEAAALDTLGYAQSQLGNHAEAVAWYQRAVDLYGDLSDRHDRAEVLIHLGDAHRAVGDDGAARHAWQRALALLEDMDHPDAGRVRARLDGRWDGDIAG